MKNLIYQYWIGKMEPCALAGKKAMEKYAKEIGAEYRFDKNPKFIATMTTNWVSHLSALRPVFDINFHEYDNVMYVDLDVFPVDELKENIFDSDIGEMAICEEVHMPKLRQENGRGPIEEQWAKRVENLYDKKMPRNEEGLLKIFNSGVVIYSKKGMKKAINTFIPIQKFADDFVPHFNKTIYYRDQAYVSAMLFVGGLDWRLLHSGWNTQIHWKPNTEQDNNGMRPVIDNRNKETKFVHVQLSGSGNWSYDKIWQAVNLPVDEWVPFNDKIWSSK